MNSIINIQTRDFNTSQAFLAAAVGWTDLFTYQVPSKSKMVLTHFSNYMATADWGEVTWRIMRNGVPVFPYETILDQIGISTLPRLIERIVYEGADYCQIQVSKTAASVANDLGIAGVYEEVN